MIPRWDVPVDIGRDDAARDAARELAKPVYGAHEPPLLLRVIQAVVDWFQHLLARAAEAAPGGVVGLVIVALLLGGLVALVLWQVGRPRRTARAARSVFAGRARSAAEHRADADAAAARGEWSAAVRHRFRAVVRALEERDVIDERPGRTADEAASDAARVLPDVAGDLVAGARLFDEVVYGGRAAGPADDERLRDLDRASGRAPMRAPTTAALAGWQPVG